MEVWVGGAEDVLDGVGDGVGGSAGRYRMEPGTSVVTDMQFAAAMSSGCAPIAAEIDASVSPSLTTYGCQPDGGRQVVGGGGKVAVEVPGAREVAVACPLAGPGVSDGAGVTGMGVWVAGIGSISRRCSAIAVERLAPIMTITTNVMASPPAICRQPDIVKAPGSRRGSRRYPG
jgi:hypothetical protein